MTQPNEIYKGPAEVQAGQRFRLIDPLLDGPLTTDEYQHQLHADQAALVLSTGPISVQVETLDGARFWVGRRWLL